MKPAICPVFSANQVRSLATVVGNDLVLQLNLAFKPAFRGAKNIYMYTRDQTGQNSGVEMKGSYTVQ